MEFWARIIPRLVSSLMSIVDSANLRNNLYEFKEEHEIMWTALDDIKRMYPDTPAGQMAKNTLDKVENRYGRF